MPIAADDSTIAAALESADIPTLLAVLVQLTGDTSRLESDIRPVASVYLDSTGGIDATGAARIRADALAVLKQIRDEARPVPPPLPQETLAEMMRFSVGERIPDEYVEMILEEMALEGRARKSIDWRRKPDESVLRDFHVLVIGAGMSGLCAAIRLEEAGLPYTVVEKNETVGGTWLENRYPGCRVDVPNHFYSYSFEPNHDWPEYFSRRDELQAYFEHCATKYGVRPHIRFRTEVVSARWNEAKARWEVVLRTEDGSEELLEASAIVSGVGQLNRPKRPSIEGLETFAGPAFHTARWEHQHDLRGKRVAVVGNGASAMQLVPVLAQEVERLVVFQRSPQWAVSHPDYFRTVSEGKKWLLKEVPYYARWYRFRLMWSFADALHGTLLVDPEWKHPERSLNAVNDAFREIFTSHIRNEIGDDPELLAKVVPSYPPYGKRMLLDNGWFKTLTREDVELVTDAIARVEPGAIVTANGERHPVDAIVFATGFHTNRFLWPMAIRGRSGALLNEVWGENPRAYLGITVPDFPNLFCLYGPNTNLGHGGSIIFHTECQVRYVLGCLREILEGGFDAMECRREVHDDYNERVDAAHARMVWTHRGMDNWYKNAEGRVTTNSPWRLVDYWRMTREPDPSDFVFTRSRLE